MPIVIVPLDAPGADNHDRRKLREAHQVGRGPVDGQQLEKMPVAVAIVGVPFCEPVDLEFLSGKGADDPDAGQVFLKRRGHDPLGFLGLLERSLDPAEKYDREQNDHRHERRRRQSHFPIQPEQNGNADGDPRAGLGDLDHLLAIEEANGIDVAGAALHDVAGLDFVVPGHRHMLKMPGKPVAEISRDRFTGDSGESALDAHEGRRRGGDDDRHQRDNCQRHFRAPPLSASDDKPGRRREIGRRMHRDDTVDRRAGNQRSEIEHCYASKHRPIAPA